MIKEKQDIYVQDNLFDDNDSKDIKRFLKK